MEKRPRHRPKRRFDKMERMMFDCELECCPHCGQRLRGRRPWHMQKTVQTLKGVVRLVGKSKECANPECSHRGEHYYSSRVWLISLPHSTYGLDVLAYIGWQHEHEHKQLVEIQKQLNAGGIVINESNVGNLYRQFLALLGGAQEETRRVLEETVKKHGGVIWAIDALKPEGCGILLDVLYEVLSGTPVAALQVERVTAEELAGWLKPYQEAFPVLATLSDGEETIAAAFEICGKGKPHQLCQMHFLGNVVEEVLKQDDQLRQKMRDDLGGLPAAPKQAGGEGSVPPFLDEQGELKLLQLKQESRQGIRDAVNRGSRKPFYWGGLAGYQQLEMIQQALTPLLALDSSEYFQRVLLQVNRTLANNREAAHNLAEAHPWLLQIADCLNYPPNSPAHRDRHFTSAQVAANMEKLIHSFHPDPDTQQPQCLILSALRKRWKFHQQELLPCDDIPGLPQDNLQMESLFEHLRRRQRRISGRKSTRELGDSAQAQVLFRASSEASLLEQIRRVPWADYHSWHSRLRQVERPRQFIQSLHLDPLATMERLVKQCLSHCATSATGISPRQLPAPT